MLYRDVHISQENNGVIIIKTLILVLSALNLALSLLFQKVFLTPIRLNSQGFIEDIGGMQRYDCILL